MFGGVISYYETYREQERLERGIGLLEFERTLDVFRRTLPAPPATILDVGGGPGVYACRLAAQGYEVHLIDPVPMHIQQARWACRHRAALESRLMAPTPRISRDPRPAPVQTA